MTQETSPQEGTRSWETAARSLAFGRGSRARLVREFLVPVLAFLAPIVALEVLQRQGVAGTLFLGWDSSTYAWWATLVQTHGAAAAVGSWHYPQLYVLLLSALGWAIGSVTLAEQVLPVLVGIPLAWAYYRLSVRLTDRVWLGILAAFLGGISVDTIYLVADLQRNLLALGIALPLGAAIQADLFSGRLPSRRLWIRAIGVWTPLLFVVLGTQIETYVVLALALLLGACLTWDRKRFLQGLLVILAPLAIAAPIVWDFLAGYTSETSLLLPFGLADIIFGVWLYLSGFALLFIAVGVVVLRRKARGGDPTARFLWHWLAALVLLLPIALAIHIPPTRLLLVVPVPILLVLAFPTAERWTGQVLRHVLSRANRVDAPPQADRSRSSVGAAASVPTFTLAVAVVLLAAPLAYTTGTNQGQYLVPFVTQGAVGALSEAGRIVRSLGYSDAILVLYGPSSAYYAAIYRAYFGMQVPDSLAYYGKLQFLFSLPDPGTVYSFKFDAAVESTYAVGYRNEIETRIGASGVFDRPIVIAGEASYPLPASEVFLAPFERAPGIYVIPPGAVTARQMDTWRLFGYADCFDCGVGLPELANWSDSRTVLQDFDVWGTKVFNASYVFNLRQGWSGGTFRIRFWDWPASMGNRSRGTVVFAPLTVYLDATPILVYDYQGLGPIQLNATLGPVAAGLHRVNVESGGPGYGVAVSLDDLEFVPTG